METLNKIANDLVWFTSQEFNFFNVEQSLTTGSSIMPHKRNLDIMEVLRANTSLVHSYQIQTQTVSRNLIAGYNKDLKITKKALIDSINITLDSISIVDLLFKNLKPNKDKLISNLSPEIFATDLVNQLVADGVPFREAYQTIGNNLETLTKQNYDSNIKNSTHLGSTGNLGIEILQKEINQLNHSIQSK